MRYYIIQEDRFSKPRVACVPVGKSHEVDPYAYHVFPRFGMRRRRTAECELKRAIDRMRVWVVSWETGEGRVFKPVLMYEWELEWSPFGPHESGEIFHSEKKAWDCYHQMVAS